MLCPYNTNVRIPHQIAIYTCWLFPSKAIYKTDMMLAASWDEPEVHCHAVVTKHSGHAYTDCIRAMHSKQNLSRNIKVGHVCVPSYPILMSPYLFCPGVSLAIKSTSLLLKLSSLFSHVISVSKPPW